LKAGSQRLVD